MSAGMYRRPSFDEIAERVAAGLAHAVPVTPGQPEAATPAVVDVPAVRRSADCDRCGYRRNMLGHVWACVAPGGRLRS
jgi:hypothetical protein